MRFSPALRDRRAVTVEHLLEAASGVDPTGRQRQRPARAVRPGQPVVAGVAVDLHRSLEALEQLLAMLAAAAGHILIHAPRRVRPGPPPLLARHRPHVAGLGLAPARVEHPDRGLVQPEVVRRLQLRLQALEHGPQMERRLADPTGQCRAVQVDPRTGVDLRLAVEGKMVGKLRYQHVGEQAFGGQGSLDEVRRCRRLGDAFLALAAGVLRAHRDDDLELRRNDVKPLGAILADLRHLATTARTQRALGLDHIKDPRQVSRQMTDVALRGRALGTRRRRRRRARRSVGLGLGERAFEFLEGEQELVGVELLGLVPEHRPAQLVEQVFETAVGVFQVLVAVGERGDLGAKRLNRRLLGLRTAPTTAVQAMRDRPCRGSVP